MIRSLIGFSEMADLIIAGMKMAIEKVESEAITNNYRKMHGLPLKRKIYKKDKRNKLARSIRKLRELTVRKCKRR